MASSIYPRQKECFISLLRASRKAVCGGQRLYIWLWLPYSTRQYQFRYFCPAKNSKQTASSKQQEYISSSERLQIRRQSVAQKGKGGCPRQNVVYIVVVPWPRRKRSKKQSSWLSSSSGGSVALEVFSVFFTYYIYYFSALLLLAAIMSRRSTKVTTFTTSERPNFSTKKRSQMSPEIEFSTSIIIHKQTIQKKFFLSSLKMS